MKKNKIQLILQVLPLLLVFIQIANYIHIQNLNKKLNILQYNAMYYLTTSFDIYHEIEIDLKLNNLLKQNTNSYYLTPIDVDKVVKSKGTYEPMINSAKKVIALDNFYHRSKSQIENIWDKKFITLEDIILFNHQIYAAKSDIEFLLNKPIEKANKLQILLFILLCLTSFINIILYLRTEKEFQLERDFFMKAIEKAKSNRSV